MDNNYKVARAVFNSSWLLLAGLLLLAGCGGGGGDDTPAAGGDPATLNFSCTGSQAYVPPAGPIVLPAASGMATTTVILLHGKQSSPVGPVSRLFTGLNAANFDVVAPYLPWGGNTWTGTLCEGLVYLNELVEAEGAKGRNVVLAGHSMGGVHALIYGAIPLSSAVKAIIPIAPGHFPHLSKKIQSDTASSIARARQLVASGMGDVLDTFTTRNLGKAVDISATPRAYLSYHALNEFPDIRQVLPLQVLPVLWIGGRDDSLTTVMNYASLSGRIRSANSRYQLLDGDHFTVLDNSVGPMSAWLAGVGL